VSALMAIKAAVLVLMDTSLSLNRRSRQRRAGYAAREMAQNDRAAAYSLSTRYYLGIGNVRVKK
jgi:hypothetical protein